MNGVQKSNKDQKSSEIGYKKMIDCGFFFSACSLRASIMHIQRYLALSVLSSLRKCFRYKNAVASCDSFVVRLQGARCDGLFYTKPSYNDSADTIVSSRLLPSWKNCQHFSPCGLEKTTAGVVP